MVCKVGYLHRLPTFKLSSRCSLDHNNLTCNTQICLGHLLLHSLINQMHQTCKQGSTRLLSRSIMINWASYPISLSPSPVYRALFVLGSFREYRAGVCTRCTTSRNGRRWTGDRSRLRCSDTRQSRSFRRPEPSELRKPPTYPPTTTTSDATDLRPNGHARSPSAWKHATKRCQRLQRSEHIRARSWTPSIRSLRPHARCRSFRSNSKHAFPNTIQLRTGPAAGRGRTRSRTGTGTRKVRSFRKDCAHPTNGEPGTRTILMSL